MRRMYLIMALAAAPTLLAGPVMGQSLEGVQPTSLNDYYYAQDVPPEEAPMADPVEAMAEPAAAPVYGSSCGCASDACGYGCASDCGCASSCGSCCGGCGGCDFCDHGDPVVIWDALLSHMFGECHESCLSVGGWTQVGYHTDSTGLFNTHPDALRLHQQWFWADLSLLETDNFSLAGRFDGIYGYDGPDTQAFGDPGTWDTTWTFGNNTGWAIPQLYLEASIGDKLTVKAGHFYTLVGYEVVQATGNFFYSHAFSQYTIQPFTHTGFLAEYAAHDLITLYGGYTLGWDTGFSQYNDDENDGSNFLGGVALQLTDNISMIYGTTAGDFGAVGDGYEHAIVIDATVTDKLNVVFETDYYDVEKDGIDTDVVSMIGWAFYEINGCLSFGQRMEYYHIAASNGANDVNGDVYEYTVGFNVRPHANLVFRPEYRYQWGDTTGTAFLQDGLGAAANSGIFGVDMVLTY